MFIIPDTCNERICSNVQEEKCGERLFYLFQDSYRTYARVVTPRCGYGLLVLGQVKHMIRITTLVLINCHYVCMLVQTTLLADQVSVRAKAPAHMAAWSA